MKAGALDRLVEFQAMAVTVNDAGTRVEAWSTVATVRAQRIEPSTREALANGVETTTARTVYRVRFLPGITTDLRLVDGSDAFNVVAIREQGRRRGLDLDVVRIA